MRTECEYTYECTRPDAGVVQEVHRGLIRWVRWPSSHTDESGRLPDPENYVAGY